MFDDSWLMFNSIGQPRCTKDVYLLGVEVSFDEGPKYLGEGPKCLFQKGPKYPIGTEVVGADRNGRDRSVQTHSK